MVLSSPSPFASPVPGLRVKKGAPPIPRPTKTEAALFPGEARKLIDDNWEKQRSFLTEDMFDLEWVEGRHFILAGGTGPGLGGAIATALLNLLGEKGSLTIVARDLSQSIGYWTGVEMRERAEKAGFGNRFHWINDGLALEGRRLDTTVTALKSAGADRLVYINTVAAAKSGLLPGLPPVFVKDVDENGLFQWELLPLDDRSIEITKFVMGTMSVEFPHILEKAGFVFDVSAFADWRGSLDLWGRDPSNYQYGRCGPYSTSLYLPKEIIQAATTEAYHAGKLVLDIFLPVMRTRALDFIPGGRTMAAIYSTIMKAEKARQKGIPELALGMLNQIGMALEEGDRNPFPRLDSHEAPFELWYYEVIRNLNGDENSEFYFERWVENGS